MAEKAKMVLWKSKPKNKTQPNQSIEKTGPKMAGFFVF